MPTKSSDSKEQSESTELIHTLVNEISDLKNRLKTLEEKSSQVTDTSHVYTRPADVKATNVEGESHKSTGMDAGKAQIVHDKLEELAEKYGNGLTMHGLQYVYISGTLERFLWTIVVSTSLGLLFYGLHSLTNRYLQYDVNQSHTVYQPKAIKLPSFTICSTEAVDNYLNCYQGQTWDGSVFSACKNSSLLPSLRMIACRTDLESKRVPRWFLDLRECSNMQVRTSLHGACITLNAEQTVVQKQAGSAGRVTFLVRYDPGILSTSASKEFQGIIHSAGEQPILTPEVGIPFDLNSTSYGQGFEISRHTEYRRLPPPYTLNNLPCTPLKPPSLIVSKTKQFPCLKTCIFKKQREKCGGLNDLWQSYMPADKQRNSEKTDTREVLKCIIRHNFQEEYKLTWDVCPDCPPLCDRNEYTVSSKNSMRIDLESMWIHKDQGKFFQQRGSAKRNYYIDFWYGKLEHEVVSESEKYPWFSFVAEFGGFLGLLTGCSAITLVEIILLFTVLFIKTCIQLCYRKNIRKLKDILY